MFLFVSSENVEVPLVHLAVFFPSLVLKINTKCPTGFLIHLPSLIKINCLHVGQVLLFMSSENVMCPSFPVRFPSFTNSKSIPIPCWLSYPFSFTNSLNQYCIRCVSVYRFVDLDIVNCPPYPLICYLSYWSSHPFLFPNSLSQYQIRGFNVLLLIFRNRKMSTSFFSLHLLRSQNRTLDTRRHPLPSLS